MQFADWQSIGKILRPHGFKGECLLKFEITGWQNLKKLESVMLLINNKPVPFFIKAISVRSDGRAVVRFENFSTEEDAKRISGSAIFAKMEIVKKAQAKSFNPEALVDYTVIDEKHGNIGFIKEVVKNPAHAIFQIIHGKIEILIPAIDKQIVKEINHAEKTVLIAAPEGLVEMYMDL